MADRPEQRGQGRQRHAPGLGREHRGHAHLVGPPLDLRHGRNTDQKGRVRHNGVWFTYTASQLLLPSGYGIAVIGNSGIGLGNEGTDQLADGLASLVEGAKPSAGAPIRLVIDLTLAGLTLLSLFLGIRNLRRSQSWATRLATRPAWRPAVRLLPRLVPLALLVALPDLLGLLYGGGRDINYVQLGYYSLALVTWTAVAAAMNLGVLGARTAALLRLRRPTGTTPVPEAPAQIVSDSPGDPRRETAGAVVSSTTGLPWAR